MQTLLLNALSLLVNGTERRLEDMCLIAQNDGGIRPGGYNHTVAVAPLWLERRERTGQSEAAEALRAPRHKMRRIQLAGSSLGLRSRTKVEFCSLVVVVACSRNMAFKPPRCINNFIWLTGVVQTLLSNPGFPSTSSGSTVLRNSFSVHISLGGDIANVVSSSSHFNIFDDGFLRARAI